MGWDIPPERANSTEWDPGQIADFTFYNQLVYMRMNSSHLSDIPPQSRGLFMWMDDD